MKDRTKANKYSLEYHHRQMADPAYRVKRQKWAARYRANHPNKAKENWFRSEYGITIEQKDALFERQGRKCAICGSLDPKNKKGVWHVDHCHKSQSIRGILCQPCNMMLGQAEDKTETLQSAIHYLELARLIG